MLKRVSEKKCIPIEMTTEMSMNTKAAMIRIIYRVSSSIQFTILLIKNMKIEIIKNNITHRTRDFSIEIIVVNTVRSLLQT